jgi:hypothetical protein
VAEAAVVGRQHDIKGESVFAYVVLRGELPTGARAEKLTRELRDWVTDQLGAIARPDDIRFANNLPKTRSGKIMRRLLRAIARNEDIAQDLSTLENPAIIDQLRDTGPATPAEAKTAKPQAKVKAKAKASPTRRKAVARKAAKKSTAKKSVAKKKVARKSSATKKRSGAARRKK